MPRFARIFFILLASAAGSCSSEQLAQKQVEKKDIRQQLATAYESCVRTSFASQLPTMVDRNMAIDQAFTVCQTEEKNFKMSAMRPSRPTATR
jgi:type II secretory pathway component PulF